MYFKQSQWTPVQRLYCRVNVVVFLLVGLVLLLLFFAAPTEASEDDHRLVLGALPLPSLCFNTMITGKPCPGCGTTRAAALWMKGHTAAARLQHPSGPWVGRWLIGQILLRLTLLLLGPHAARVWVIDAVVSPGAFFVAAYLPLFLN